MKFNLLKIHTYIKQILQNFRWALKTLL